MNHTEQNLCSFCCKLNNLVLRGPDKGDEILEPSRIASHFIKLPKFSLKSSKNAAGQAIDPDIACYYGPTLSEVISQRHSCVLCNAISQVLQTRDDYDHGLDRRVALRFVTKSGYTSDTQKPWNHGDEQLLERHQQVSSFRVEKNYGIAGLAIDLESNPGSGIIPRAGSIGLRVFKPAGLTQSKSASEGTNDILEQLEKACPSVETASSISTGTVDLVKEWLSDCVKNHSTSEIYKCHQTVSGQVVNDDVEESPLPTRLIAVNSKGDSRLLATQGMVGRYVALSYRWGAVTDNTWKLRKANLEESLQELPYAQLPSTIRDAIELTRQLGFSYLWIDSCCIVQDDSADWAREAATMQAVYQNAIVTIAVLGDRDSHSGFLDRREPPPAIKIPWVDEKGNKVTNVLVSEFLQFRRLGNRDECMTDLEQELGSSPWSTRGWTFQEQLLSRRIVYIGQHQLYFECRKGKFSENGFDQTLKSPSQKQSFIEGLDTDFSSALSSYLKNPQSWGMSPWMSKLLSKTHDPVMQIQRKCLKLDIAQIRINIDSLLYDYTSRSLTNQEDRLIAFEGLANAIASRGGQEYHAGLWTNKVAKSLFWWMKDGPETPNSSLRAPTWSWASRDGVIKGYDTEMLTNDEVRVERKHIDRGAFDGALKKVQIVDSNFLVADRQGAKRISLRLTAPCYKSPCILEPASNFPLTWQQLQKDIRLWSSANAGWNPQYCHLLFAPIDDAIGPKGWLQKKKRGELRRCPQCHRIFGEMDDHTAITHIEHCLKGEPIVETREPASLKALVGVAYFDTPEEIPSSYEIVFLWRARSINTYYKDAKLWPDFYRKGAEGLAATGFYRDRYGWTLLKRSEEKILGFEGRDVYFSMDDVGSGAAFIQQTNPRIFFCLLVEPTNVEGAYKRCGIALAYWINGASGSGGLPLHLNCTEKVMTLV